MFDRPTCTDRLPLVHEDGRRRTLICQREGGHGSPHRSRFGPGCQASWTEDDATLSTPAHGLHAGWLIDTEVRHG